MSEGGPVDENIPVDLIVREGEGKTRRPDKRINGESNRKRKRRVEVGRSRGPPLPSTTKTGDVSESPSSGSEVQEDVSHRDCVLL